MKVLIALACVIAATSALPYILLDDGEPSYRVRRQLEPQGFKRPVLKRQDQFVDQYEDDLDSAADTPYGAAVSLIRNRKNFALQVWVSHCGVLFKGEGES